MSARAGALQVLRRQRAAADRLRREVFGDDGSLQHPYFRDLRRQLRSWSRKVTPAQVQAACARADLVYVGDFHADPLCQAFAAETLAAAVAHGKRPVLLGVEFLYTRQQPLLDARQEGRLSDPEFLRRVHYREEWGYPWDGFRDLLDRARELGVPVVALDAPPRGGFEGLRRRDQHAARRIAAVLAAERRARMVVLFGESHLSPGHIPGLVERLLRRERALRAVTVFQDPDVLYWSLLRQGGPVPPAVELSPGSFAVFRSSPLARYEAYRQVLDRWRGDVPAEEEVDLTPAVHHLIRSLLGWLGIRADRYRLRHHGGWGEDLVDAFPEVYGGADAADLLRPILEDHGRTPSELREAERLFAERGALYDARANTLFLSRYLPGNAAGEAARFLRAALSGRLFRGGDDETAPPAVRLYGAAYNEGLACLGARLLDPASGFQPRPAPEPRDPDAAAWLAEHLGYERSPRVLPPLPLLDAAASSRALRRAVARELGQRLGLILFDRVRSGVWTARELRSAFSRSLEGGRAARLVVSLLRGGVA